VSGSTAVERVSARKGAMIGAICGLVVALAWAVGATRFLDLRLHDWRYHLRGAKPASDRIAIVELDDQTLGSDLFKDVWPIPRRYYAMAIDALENAGAQAVMFDLVFQSNDPTDSLGDQWLASITSEHDNVIQAIAFQHRDAPMSGQMAAVSDSAELIRHGRPVSQQRLASAQVVSLPYGDLLTAAHDIGHTAVLIDKDGVVRRIPQFIRFGEWAYGSLPIRLVEVAARRDSTLPQFELTPEGITIFWKGRRKRVPSDAEGGTSIVFAGDERAFKNRYSMLQVLHWYRDEDTTSLARAFRGKLVMVGSTTTGVNAIDLGAIPFSSVAPLVYVHANAANAALQGRFLREVSAPWIILALIALGTGLGLWYSRLSLLHAALVALGAILGVAAADYGLFVLADISLPPLGAMLVPPITWAAVENVWRREAEDRARARAKELDVAHAIQEQMLPLVPPKIVGLEVAGRNIPAESIGGDYYDWVPLGKDSVAIVIGDVSGHGIPAALLMAHLRASFHAVVESGRSPAEMVETVNRSLARATMPGKFATFFLGIISVKEGTLSYCNAGHNSPYLVRNGEVIELTANGPPIAVVEHMPFTGAEQKFVAGDILVVYSDGIPEAPNRNQPKVFYGDDRLKQRTLALSSANNGASHILEGILADVRALSGERMHVDDVTIVVVRRT